jgi:hypothetical protein
MKPDTDAYARLAHVDDAVRHLELARWHLAKAAAPRALARVRLALSSAEGAQRHAENRRIARRYDAGAA